MRRIRSGQHETSNIGQGHERTYDTKRTSTATRFQLDLNRTIRNAVRRTGGRVTGRLHPDDFEIEKTEHFTRSSTVLMLDLSLSMPMRDNFLPAKKVAMALHSLISSQFPRDYLGLVGFSETARVLTPSSCPRCRGTSSTAPTCTTVLPSLASCSLGSPGTKQIIMITDGEPTAHITPDGYPFFNYPPARETIEATLREVVRCTKEQIRINTFGLGADGSLRAFIEQMTSINRGRAFFTTPENLGDYVLVDFMEGKRALARSARRAG